MNNDRTDHRMALAFPLLTGWTVRYADTSQVLSRRFSRAALIEYTRAFCGIDAPLPAPAIAA